MRGEGRGCGGLGGEGEERGNRKRQREARGSEII